MEYGHKNIGKIDDQCSSICFLKSPTGLIFDRAGHKGGQMGPKSVHFLYGRPFIDE